MRLGEFRSQNLPYHLRLSLAVSELCRAVVQFLESAKEFAIVFSMPQERRMGCDCSVRCGIISLLYAVLWRCSSPMPFTCRSGCNFASDASQMPNFLQCLCGDGLHSDGERHCVQCIGNRRKCVSGKPTSFMGFSQTLLGFAARRISFAAKPPTNKPPFICWQITIWITPFLRRA